MAKQTAPHRLIHFLGQTCQQLRTDSKTPFKKLVGPASLDQSALSRFEKGQGWPRDVERVVIAYAEASGEDPRMVWVSACEWWLKDGSRPTISGEVIAGTKGEEIPADVLKAMEDAIAAYARRQANPHTEAASDGTPSRAASGSRGRP